ncbi:MAG: hypothetical protein CM1200mP27_04590 [Chloroflexota bacterium]|nr:MAG: hypothetical protein CM1200mP27_04590 [Chloroflexota bacterium]
MLFGKYSLLVLEEIKQKGREAGSLIFIKAVCLSALKWASWAHKSRRYTGLGDIF